MRRACTVAVLWFCCPGSAFSAEPPARAPEPSARGQVYAWKSADGIQYHYFIPASYDPARGANLVLLFHDLGLDRTWAFQHYVPGQFRPDDVLVAPDGPSPSGAGFQFRQADKDVNAIHHLQLEVAKALQPKAAFLCGFGQGSGFALYYAGAKAANVQGVVAHAGAWRGTQLPKEARGQAIAFLHGSVDASVPVADSAAAHAAFAGAGYGALQFCILRGAGHEPDAGAAAQLLTWCDGMTTTDSERVDRALALLDAAPSGGIFSARYQLAERLAGMTFTPPEVKARAKASAERVEALASLHAAAIAKGMGAGGGKAFDGKPWIGHLLCFLQDFRGLPAREEVARRLEPLFEDHRAIAKRYRELYQAARDSDTGKAFVAGVDLVAKAYLADGVAGGEVLERLRQWKAEAAKHAINKTTLKYYEKTVPVFEQALEAGAGEYRKLNG